MKRALLALVLVLGLSPLAHAQTDFAALEKEVEAAREKYKIPGLSLGVIQDGKLVYAHGFGLRDVARKLPATADTLYCIGSSTKAFTATAVLMAVDAGKVKLTDRPVQYLPYFQLRDPEAREKITVSDLLCHRSGLPRTDFMMLAAEGTLSRKELIQAVGQARPTAKLGEKFQYQNILFAAAGEIASTAFGMPYEQVIEQKIFRPLKMTRSTLSVPAALKDPDHAVGYDPTSLQPLAWREITATAPAGAINSSVKDMALWVEAMLRQGKPLLSAESYAAMTRQQMAMSPKAGYGYGWMLHPWKGNAVVEHGGNIDGFNAEIAFVPEKKWGLVMLTNVSQSPMAGEIQELVWHHLSGEKPEPAPPTETGKRVPPPVPTKDEAGTYTATTVPLVMKVAWEKDHLTVTVPGQPTYGLEHAGGRVYRLAPPLPPTFRVSFHEKGLTLEQPGVTLELVKQVPTLYTPPLSVDALLEKMLTASGGRENWKKHQSRVEEVRVDFENQGMQASGENYVRGGQQAQRLRLTAVDKQIGWMASGYDGKNAWGQFSFLPAPGPRPSERARAEADFAQGLLEPRAFFKTIEITGVETVGDVEHGIAPEACYVLLKTTPSGERMTEYVSTTRFLVLRRDTGSPAYFTDFRESGGVLLPHTMVEKSPNMGSIVTTTQRIRWDVPIDSKLFAP